MEEKNLRQALLKKAMGGICDEVVEEYAAGKDGRLVLQKRKTTQKYNPPDVSALKILLDEEKTTFDYSKMTDAELEKEKVRLLKLLREKEKENEDGYC